jgi:hypothetical protein
MALFGEGRPQGSNVKTYWIALYDEKLLIRHQHHFPLSIVF